MAGESGELALRFDKSIPGWKQMSVRCAIQKSNIIGPPSFLDKNVVSSECLYVSFRARDLGHWLEFFYLVASPFQQRDLDNVH